MLVAFLFFGGRMISPEMGNSVVPINRPGLVREHLEDLRKSGLTDETIVQLGIVDCPPDSIKINGVTSAYTIPYYDLDGAPSGFSRYRLFPPARTRDDHAQKYHQPSGSGVHLYFPSIVDWRAVAVSAAHPLIVTEGEKKAAKACQEGFPCIGSVVYGIRPRR
jgi:hypothetical protein